VPYTSERRGGDKERRDARKWSSRDWRRKEINAVEEEDWSSAESSKAAGQDGADEGEDIEVGSGNGSQ
jgi:hypothetical protein